MKILLALLLLAQQPQGPGWTNWLRCWELARQCDLVLHPHTADQGLPKQGACDSYFPTFGAVGTTVRLYTHRARCMVSTSTKLTVGSPCFLFVGSGPAMTLTPDGWSLVSGVSMILQSTATPGNPDVTNGFGIFDLEIPNDPSLVGQAAYLQAGALDQGAWRESAPGVVEVF